jgi:hypothetical protein
MCDTVQTRRQTLIRLVFENLKERMMSLGTILLIVLILILVGVIPSWPHSRGWGYGPSGVVGVVVAVLLVLFLLGRI